MFRFLKNLFRRKKDIAGKLGDRMNIPSTIPVLEPKLEKLEVKIEKPEPPIDQSKINLNIGYLIESSLDCITQPQIRETKSNITILNSLSDLVNNATPIIKIEESHVGEDFIKHLRITNYALEKIFLLSKIVAELYGNYEVYCLMIGDNYIVKDILIPRQEISCATVYVSGEAIMDISSKIKDSKYHVLGWSHSHAIMSVFYSGIDVRNQINIFNETSNYVNISDGQSVDRLKYCYGMTINLKRETYCVVSTKKESALRKTIVVPIEVISSDNINIDVIRNDIMKNIRDKISTPYSYKNYNRNPYYDYIS